MGSGEFRAETRKEEVGGLRFVFFAKRAIEIGSAERARPGCPRGGISG